MTSNLKRLAELTKDLPELDALEIPIGGPVVAFKRERENVTVGFGFGVYRDATVAMMRAFIPKGAVIEAHAHKTEHEWIGVISGKLQIDRLDRETPEMVGECQVCHIPPGVPHITTALEDTWRWSVTVPPAAGYPDVTGCPMAAKVPLVINT